MGKSGKVQPGEGATAPTFLDRLPEYCSILLSGPPGVGKFEYMMGALQNFLEDGHPVVFVCIDVGPGDVRAYLRRKDYDLSAALGHGLFLIDCFSAAVSEEEGEDQEGVRLVSSLSNLEGLGMAITQGAANHDRPVKVLLYTISTLFLHNSVQSLSKFFQIVSARVRTQMGAIMYANQEGVSEERHERLLRSLVDGVLDMRFNPSMEREIMLHHLRGHRVIPEWVPLPDDGRPAGKAPGRPVERRKAA